MTRGLVIGAGPAGLMAAQVMAEAGLHVVLAEAKPTPARKFLMAGKSGLNLTKEEPFATFLDGYDCPQDIQPALQSFGPTQVKAFAEGLGQTIFAGSSGRVFPKTMKASPMLRAWLARLNALGVELRVNRSWQGVPAPGQAHRFTTPDGEEKVRADCTVLALGGASWARLGSNGAWFDGFRTAGIPVSDFKPMNMGFRVDWSVHMARYFGQPLKNLAIKAADRTVRGESVVTQQGIEGGVIYAVSGLIRDGSEAYLDLLPDMTSDQVEDRLSQQPFKASLTNRLRKGLKLPPLKVAILQEWARPLPPDPVILAPLIKKLPMKLGPSAPLDEAISTGGGVMFQAVDDHLMLKSHPGIFCAGEMLDWEAPTGGYLITACLAQGAWAGKAAAAYAGRLAKAAL